MILIGSIAGEMSDARVTVNRIAPGLGRSVSPPLDVPDHTSPAPQALAAMLQSPRGSK